MRDQGDIHHQIQRTNSQNVAHAAVTAVAIRAAINSTCRSSRCRAYQDFRRRGPTAQNFWSGFAPAFDSTRHFSAGSTSSSRTPGGNVMTRVQASCGTPGWSG